MLTYDRVGLTDLRYSSLVFVFLHVEGNSHVFLDPEISKVTDTDTPVCVGQDRARPPS